MRTKTEICVDAYQKHMHLHNAAKSIGVPWQTVYWHLRKAGIPVTGDKSRYGSPADRLAARAEERFQTIVPFAQSMNAVKFQSKVDFMVGLFGVDVKCGRLLRERWAFSVKKQESIADFFVCFCLSRSDRSRDAEFLSILLIPGEVARCYATISLSNNVRGKWWKYEVSSRELAEFFQTAQDFRSSA